MNREHKSLLFVPVLLTIITSGCMARLIKTPPPHIEITTPGARFIVHGMRSELEYETMREAVLKMSPAMQRAIQFISIYADNDQHIEPDAAAHCHNGRIICTRRAEVEGRLIYHETAHARADQIPDSATHAWAKRSTRLFNPYERGHSFNTWICFPWHGIVTEYGAKDYREDIAEWTMRVIEIVEDGYVNPFTYIDKADPDWMWKLNFLLEWEFITQRQYDKVAPMLQ